MSGSSVGSTPSQRCQSDEEAESAAGWPSILRQSTRRMLLCCCWPLHKCVQALSLFDTTLVVIAAYKSFNQVQDSWPETQWITIGQLFFFTAFSVCQVLATVLLILGQKRQLAHYLWPRLTLLVGLVICALGAIGLMFFYFSGGAKGMNEFFFAVYEWFFSEQLDEKARYELRHELKIYVGCFMALAITFAVYTIFELALTNKYYKSLKSFQPIATNDPTAPMQSAYNPDYPPQKIYPNLA